MLPPPSRCHVLGSPLRSSAGTWEGLPPRSLPVSPTQTLGSSIAAFRQKWSSNGGSRQQPQKHWQPRATEPPTSTQQQQQQAAGPRLPCAKVFDAEHYLATARGRQQAAMARTTQRRLLLNTPAAAPCGQGLSVPRAAMAKAAVTALTAAKQRLSQPHPLNRHYTGSALCSRGCNPMSPDRLSSGQGTAGALARRGGGGCGGLPSGPTGCTDGAGECSLGPSPPLLSHEMPCLLATTERLPVWSATSPDRTRGSGATGALSTQPLPATLSDVSPRPARLFRSLLVPRRPDPQLCDPAAEPDAFCMTWRVAEPGALRAWLGCSAVVSAGEEAGVCPGALANRLRAQQQQSFEPATARAHAGGTAALDALLVDLQHMQQTLVDAGDNESAAMEVPISSPELHTSNSKETVAPENSSSGASFSRPCFSTKWALPEDSMSGTS